MIPQHEQPSPNLEANDVYHYLLNHQEFLADYPELINVLKVPGQKFASSKVLDFQSHVIDRLQDEMITMHMLHGSLYDTSQSNMTVQQRMLDAALVMQQVETLDDFLNTLSQLPVVLGIDTAALCVVLGDVPAKLEKTKNISVLLQSQFLAVTGGDTDIHLRPQATLKKQIYGTMQDAVGSDVLLPLDIGNHKLLLALGAAQPGTFTPDQGTDLLEYLAQTVEITLERIVE